eukprot:361284-Chlamydomonas_euryale.AAC.5
MLFEIVRVVYRSTARKGTLSSHPLSNQLPRHVLLLLSLPHRANPHPDCMRQHSSKTARASAACTRPHACAHALKTKRAQPAHHSAHVHPCAHMQKPNACSSHTTARARTHARAHLCVALLRPRNERFQLRSVLRPEVQPRRPHAHRALDAAGGKQRRVRVALRAASSKRTHAARIS